jgi:hypothetical protein
MNPDRTLQFYIFKIDFNIIFLPKFNIQATAFLEVTQQTVVYIDLLCHTHNMSGPTLPPRFGQPNNINTSSVEQIVLLEKLIVPHLVKQFPEFYGTRMFTTAFNTCHEPHQSRPSPPI